MRLSEAGGRHDAAVTVGGIAGGRLASCEWEDAAGGGRWVASAGTGAGRGRWSGSAGVPVGAGGSGRDGFQPGGGAR